MGCCFRPLLLIRMRAQRHQRKLRYVDGSVCKQALERTASATFLDFLSETQTHSDTQTHTHTHTHTPFIYIGSSWEVIHLHEIHKDVDLPLGNLHGGEMKLTGVCSSVFRNPTRHPMTAQTAQTAPTAQTAQTAWPRWRAWVTAFMPSWDRRVSRHVPPLTHMWHESPELYAAIQWRWAGNPATSQRSHPCHISFSSSGFAQRPNDICQSYPILTHMQMHVNMNDTGLR